MKSSKTKLRILATFVEIVILLVLSVQLGISGDTTVQWVNVFPHLLGLSVIIYFIVLVYLSRYQLFLVKAWKKCLKFIQRYYCEIFILVLGIYLIVYQIYYAYCEDIFISSDSSNYLREATAILNGYGFNNDGPAGGTSWFSKWPIGYPALIAFIALLTGRNVYLSSKILSMMLVLLGMFFLYKHFKKKSWMLCFIYCNLGFLKIYKYTWSENPFILCFIIYTTLLADIICNSDAPKKEYVYLGASSLLVFLMRYFGAITIIITGMVIAIHILLCWLSDKYRTAEIKGKIIKLIITDLLTGIFMVGYFLINKIKSGRISGVDRLQWRDDYIELTDNLYIALRNEILNAVRVSNFETIEQMDTGVLAGTILIIVLFIIGVMIFNISRKGIDYKVVFIIVGMLYCLLFIGVRFYSSMDLFGYRFFVPGTLLISIGVFGYVEEKLEPWSFVISTFLSLLISVFTISLVGHVCFTYDSTNTAYKLAKEEVTDELKEVPAKSLIFSFDGDLPIASAMRPDVIIRKDEIDTTGELTDLKKQYSHFDFVCIKYSVLEEKILNQDSSNSFLDLLKSIKKEGEEDRYIILPTKVEDNQERN